MSGTSAQRLPTLIGRRLDFHRVMTVVVALEIVAIVVLAAITVKQFQVFGIDEGAHLSYIESSPITAACRGSVATHQPGRPKRSIRGRSPATAQPRRARRG